MIKQINKDVMFLSKKSIDADKNDINVIKDLKDTLLAHKDDCAGMAANMIGINKRIIVFFVGIIPIVMINPKIISKSGIYKIKEGCLSLTGQRECSRYTNITVEYLDEQFNKQRNNYNGFIAEVIQHEIDHLEGIII